MSGLDLLPSLRRHYWREALILLAAAVLYLLPWAFGVVVGVWFLWQQGLGWYWWAASLAVLAAALALVRWALRAPPPRLGELEHLTPGRPHAEAAAWAALVRLRDEVGADDLRDWSAAQALVLRTLRTVATAWAPEDAAALWRFTLPEGLRMLEDLAGKLRRTLTAEVPVLRHLELTWAVRLVDAVGPTRRALALWRVVRWVNPLSALIGEVRGAVAEQVLAVLDTTARAQVAVILVEQIGAAAIRLYGGHYRYRDEELPDTAPEPLAPTDAGPLTILLAGRRHVGKSSLLNALLGADRELTGRLAPPADRCRPWAWTTPAGVPVVLVDSPAVTDDDRRAPWLRQAANSDLVLWIAAANRPDRALEQRALKALDDLTAADHRRSPIPRRLVLTHADRLDPPQEWAPPYDLEHGQGLKARRMRAARQAAAAQLGLAERDAVLVALPPEAPPWNLAALGALIDAAVPAARQKQLERARARAGGLLQVVADGLISVPQPVRQAVKGVRRWLTRRRG